MAIAMTGKTSGTNSTAATTYTTASITPTAGSVLFVWFACRGIASDIANTCSGLSGTWTLQGDLYNTSGLTTCQLSLFTCTNWTGSGTLTLGNTDSMTSGAWSVIEGTGVDLTTPIRAGSFVTTSSGGTNVANRTLTYNAAGNANNRPIVFVAGDDQDPLAIDYEAGWTEFHDVAVDLPPLGISSAWNPTTFDTSVQMNWNDGITYFTVMLGAEVVAAAAPSTAKFFPVIF